MNYLVSIFDYEHDQHIVQGARVTAIGLTMILERLTTMTADQRAKYVGLLRDMGSAVYISEDKETPYHVTAVLL